MTTLINRGYRLLNRVAESAAAERVKYIRNVSVISESLPAIVAAADIEQILDGESTLIGRQLTVRLKRSGITVDGETLRPKRGDLIEWTLCGIVNVLEVMPESGGVEADAVDPRSDWVPASVKIKERRFE